MSSAELLQLYCPVCHRPLAPLSHREEESRCHCGVGYRVTDGIIDFYPQEQTLVNAWSQNAPAPETSEQIKSWLKAGLVTTADLEYIETEVNSERLKASYQEGIRILQDAMHNESGVVLDLCTGRGSLFHDMAFVSQPTARITIMTDLSRTVLTQVRSRLKEFVPAGRYAYIACDARRLPLGDKSINLVVTVAGFQNAESATELLQEVVRVLVSGGMLYALCPFVDENSRSLLLCDFLGFGELATSARMRRALSQLGIKEIAVRTLFHDVAHERGDLGPLRGEKIEIAVVTARK